MAISSALGSSALLPAGLGFRNLIMNGDMCINQRNATVTSSGYTVDRWYQSKYGGGAVTTAQDTASVPANFKYALKTQCTVGVGAGANAATYHEQRIEGSNIIGLGFGTPTAKQLSLSFWVKSSLTGTHSIALGNSAENRKYITTYTVNAANTWEYKTISVVGDSSGTWLTDANIGLRLYFVMASGTNQQTTTTNQWFTDADGMKIAATGTVDIMATTGNSFAITGVQVEQNYQPTPFEQRPIGVELALCQRYFHVIPTGVVKAVNQYWNVNLSGGNPLITHSFPVTMRAEPTAYTSAGSGSHSFDFFQYGAGAGISRVLVYQAGQSCNTTGFRTLNYSSDNNGGNVLPVGYTIGILNTAVWVSAEL